MNIFKNQAEKEHFQSIINPKTYTLEKVESIVFFIEKDDYLPGKINYQVKIYF